jgi:hypothetical protein
MAHTRTWIAIPGRHGYRPLPGADVSEPHHPGHGPHRSPAKIHEFK